jgi:hypothetical protein
MAKAQRLTGQGAKGLGGYRGLLTPGVAARVGSHRAPRSRPLDRIATFSGPGLGQAVLTWSRPWNGTGERNAPTASTTAATRACVNGSEGPGRWPHSTVILLARRICPNSTDLFVYSLTRTRSPSGQKELSRKTHTGSPRHQIAMTWLEHQIRER